MYVPPVISCNVSVRVNYIQPLFSCTCSGPLGPGQKASPSPFTKTPDSPISLGKRAEKIPLIYLTRSHVSVYTLDKYWRVAMLCGGGK